MSILIKGMEMPKRCCSCFLCYADQDSEHNVDWICAPLCKIVNKGSIIQPKIKLDDCPLIELPPHGRLIDADAWIAKVREDLLSPHSKKGAFAIMGAMFRYVLDAPTIIESEGEE